MESRDDNAVSGFASHALHPFEHLPGRLVGEGDGKDTLRQHMALPEQMHYAGRDDLGLAGPGACQDEQWAFGGVYSAVLFWIEIFHAVLSVTRLDLLMQMDAYRHGCEPRWQQKSAWLRRSTITRAKGGNPLIYRAP